MGTPTIDPPVFVLTTPVDEPISDTRHALFRERTCSACAAGDR